METFDIIQNANLAMIFMEGLLSFLSPCVLPLLPVYISYLSSHSEGKQKGRTILFTFCFIMGIFIALFLMNVSFGFIWNQIQRYAHWIGIIAGIIIIFMGFVQMEIIKIPFFMQTKRMHMKVNQMNPLIALGLGFCFSFAWTPCIGPALTSILLMANQGQDLLLSNIYMLVYALGLTIPFMLVGIFTDQLLAFFSKKKSMLKYTMKIAGIIFILCGAYMVYDGSKVYMSDHQTISNEVADQTTDSSDKEKEETNDTSTNHQQDAQLKQIFNYPLQDQNGKRVSLADGKGKTMFVNFWATWCPPCVSELSHIQQLYDKYKDSDDVMVITISAPDTKQSKQQILDFMKDNKYTFPVWIDTGYLSASFSVNSLPMTYTISENQQPYGYINGAITCDIMEKMIQQTKEDQ